MIGRRARRANAAARRFRMLRSDPGSRAYRGSAVITVSFTPRLLARAPLYDNKDRLLRQLRNVSGGASRRRAMRRANDHDMPRVSQSSSSSSSFPPPSLPPSLVPPVSQEPRNRRRARRRAVERDDSSIEPANHPSSRASSPLLSQRATVQLYDARNVYRKSILASHDSRVKIGMRVCCRSICISFREARARIGDSHRARCIILRETQRGSLSEISDREYLPREERERERRGGEGRGEGRGSIVDTHRRSFAGRFQRSNAPAIRRGSRAILIARGIINSLARDQRPRTFAAPSISRPARFHFRLARDGKPTANVRWTRRGSDGSPTGITANNVTSALTASVFM